MGRWMSSGARRAARNQYAWLVALAGLGCGHGGGGEPAPGDGPAAGAAAVTGASAGMSALPAGQGASGSAAGAAGAAATPGAVPPAGIGGVGGNGAGAGGSATGGSDGTAGSAGHAGGDAGDGAAGNAGAGAAGASAPGSAAALDMLKTYLMTPRAERDPIAEQPFATTPLAKADAAAAQKLLWDDFAAYVKTSRASEVGATATRAASLSVGGKTLRYYMAVRGDAPPSGRSLFISMHGGGSAPAATNDSQWENQIDLVTGYAPVDALWVAPRAPGNDWNMWFTPDIEALFERLITNLIVFEGVDPNKVYLNGYSAGGDGVYQLGPRMADSWAGAAMSAGHPNDASPLNLRNVAFAIHVGGNDSAFKRNEVGAQWGMMLENLRGMDPGGYVHQWQVHAGLPHWMNLADKVAIPFVQMHTRDPLPKKVVWRQANVLHSRFYWLAVPMADAKQGAVIRAEYDGNAVTITEANQVPRATLRFTDAMLDLDQPVRVSLAGQELSASLVPRTIAVIAKTLEERGDPALIFHAELPLDLR